MFYLILLGACVISKRKMFNPPWSIMHLYDFFIFFWYGILKTTHNISTDCPMSEQEMPSKASFLVDFKDMMWSCLSQWSASVGNICTQHAVAVSSRNRGTGANPRATNIVKYCLMILKNGLLGERHASTLRQIGVWGSALLVLRPLNWT